MSARVPDISPVSGLTPKSKFFEEVGEELINVDAAIKLCQSVATPQAKAIDRAFRRRLAELRLSRPELSPEKMREEAFFSGLHDLGIRTPMTNLDGSMD